MGVSISPTRFETISTHYRSLFILFLLPPSLPLYLWKADSLTTDLYPVQAAIDVPACFLQQRRSGSNESSRRVCMKYCRPNVEGPLQSQWLRTAKRTFRLSMCR